jgi:DNA polymerase delta subunit 4
MPPTRRSRVSSGPAAKGSQKTISFAGNSKVTKATTSTSSKSKDIDITPTSSKPLEISSDIDSTPGHVSSEAAVLSQAKVELEKEKTEDEKKAEKVTNAQIRKYWRERENERTAARVHQEELSVEEKVLRLFDMSSQFGVCPMSFFLCILHLAGGAKLT